MPQPFFEARSVSKTFGGVKALDQVDLTIEKGEIHCLIGENGSGKSTLIKIVGGVHRADSGRIELEGRPLHNLSALDAIRSGVQIIYQDLSVFPNMTVAENIAINQALEDNRQLVNWRAMRETAQRALDEIGESIDLDAPVSSLPMAKKQIVAISRAVTQNAKLIIMDEATSSISREEVNHLFSIIRRLKAKGVSTLFVSHKFGEVLEISERITVFRDGRNAGTFAADELDSETLSEVMTGRKVRFAPYDYDPSQRGATPILSVRGLAGADKFADVSFDLHRGEILGIVGLLGSGRTEVAKALFGLEPPSGGEILIDGKPVEITSPSDAVNAGIALLPEDRAGEGLCLTQPVGDNIVSTVLRDLGNRFGLLDGAKRRATAERWIDRLSIKTPSTAVPANSLSGGNQQRVVLAKWLATNPSIFILDGPTIGVDIGSKQNIHAIIRDLARNGMAIILISDEVQEVLDSSNRIIMMHQGHMVDEIADPAATTAEELFDRMSNQGSGRAAT